MEFLNRPGYDQFMNIVLDNTVEIVSPTEKNEIGMVVIRGHLDVRSPSRWIGTSFGAVNPINCEKHLFWYCVVVQIWGQKPWFIAEKSVVELWSVELGPTKRMATRGPCGILLYFGWFPSPFQWARPAVSRNINSKNNGKFNMHWLPDIDRKELVYGYVWKCRVPLNPLVNDHYPY